MENTTNKDDRTRAPFYQKDYSKLEIIFNKAVERSRQKKIIHYASDRLYTATTRRKMAQESFKPVSGAEPLLEKDVQTEIVDLEKPPSEELPSEDIEREQLFEFFSNAQTVSPEEQLTSTEALKAYESLVDYSEENLVQTVEEPEISVEEESQPASEEVTGSETLDSPEFVELKDILSEIDAAEESAETVEEEPIAQSSEPEDIYETEAEPVQEDESILGPSRAREFFEEDFEEAEPEPLDMTSLEEARKDVTTSRLVLIVTAVFLGIYVVVFFTGFSGYDYVALVMSLLGFFLAFTMRPRGLIVTCVLMLVALIGCMVYTILRTSETILFYHYLWFLFIPVCMSSAYAFAKSRQRLEELDSEYEIEPEEEPEEEEDIEELLKGVQTAPIPNLSDEVVSIEDTGEIPVEPEPEEPPVMILDDFEPPESSEEPFNLDATIFDDPNYFDEDIDAYETLVEEPKEEPRETIELSDTYNNSFDWGNLLDDTERTNNTSVIDEIGEDALLSEFVESAKAEEEPSRSQTSQLVDMLSSLEGQDEEDISINSEDITWSDFINS